MFVIYTVTHDAYLHVRVREGLKTLAPRLMNLSDALLLAEMLYYTPNRNPNVNHNNR